MADYDEALQYLKMLRRAFADQFATKTGNDETLVKLATIQTAIEAIEAVKSEPEVGKPQQASFGADG